MQNAIARVYWLACCPDVGSKVSLHIVILKSFEANHYSLLC